MKHFLVILFVLISIINFSSCAEKKQEQKGYGVFLGLESKDFDKITGYDIVVIDADYFSDSDIKKLKQENNKVYTYLNVGAIENYREGYEKFEKYALGDYENWPQEKWIDVSKREWQSYLHDKSRALYEKGVDGFFLDNFDVYYYYHYERIYDGLISILADLEKIDTYLMINGANTFITEGFERREILSSVDAVNQETVFTRIDDYENDVFSESTLEDRDYFLDYLYACKDNDIDVFLLEYSKDDELKTTIKDFATENGFGYYVSRSVQLVGD